MAVEFFLEAYNFCYVLSSCLFVVAAAATFKWICSRMGEK